MSFENDQQQSNEEQQELMITPNTNEELGMLIPIIFVDILDKVKDSWDKFKFKIPSPLTPVGEVQIRDPLPFELIFSMTTHKTQAQGRTIRRAVLDLSKRPNHCKQMDFSAVFVGMSPIQNSEHMQLLYHRSPGTQND